MTHTQAQIEAAAEAIQQLTPNKTGPIELCKAFAQAALTAAADANPYHRELQNNIIERCAQAAENFRGTAHLPVAIAAAIRAMKEK